MKELIMKPIEERSAKHLKMTTYFLGFISFALFVFILIALRSFLIPITFSVFLTFLFHPLIILLKKRGVPQWITIIFILVFVFSFYYLIGLLLVSNFSAFPDKFDSYSNNLYSFFQIILRPFNLTLKEFSRLLGIDYQNFEISKILPQLFKTGVIQDLVASFSSAMSDFFIMVIFWIFMMAGKTKFEDRLRFAFSDKKESVERNILNINTQLQSYIVIKTILSLVTGLITTIILLAYGIDFAYMWGFLTFVLNFIPNIGSTIATLCPIIIGLLQYGFGFTIISMAVLLLLIQNVIGNIAEPHFLGLRMDLSPVFVLFSLIFWGWVWGIVGMFLAVPISASIKILFSNIEPLKPIAILLGSKSEPLNSQIIMKNKS